MTNTNLSLVRGDDQLLGVNITNPDGSFYNLSGCAILFDVKKGSYTKPTILGKTVTSHYGATSGASYISLAAGDTSSFGTDTYFYDIRLQSSGNLLTTLSYGTINFYPR